MSCSVNYILLRLLMHTIAISMEVCHFVRSSDAQKVLFADKQHGIEDGSKLHWYLRELLSKSSVHVDTLNDG